MTRTLGNGSVELELGTGEWTARWAGCGVVLGPCHAEVDAGSGQPATGSGAWQVETTRTGARARWTRADGARVARAAAPRRRRRRSRSRPGTARPATTRCAASSR